MLSCNYKVMQGTGLVALPAEHARYGRLPRENIIRGRRGNDNSGDDNNDTGDDGDDRNGDVGDDDDSGIWQK